MLESRLVALVVGQFFACFLKATPSSHQLCVVIYLLRNSINKGLFLLVLNTNTSPLISNPVHSQSSLVEAVSFRFSMIFLAVIFCQNDVVLMQPFLFRTMNSLASYL
jgi:hypothetical protein